MASRTARRCAAALLFRLVVTAAGRSTSLRRTRAPGGTRRAAGGCSLAEACDSSAWAQPPSRSAQGNASVLDVMVFEELATVETETAIVKKTIVKSEARTQLTAAKKKKARNCHGALRCDAL